MAYFPSSSCETESSSSLRHFVTTLRSLLRISWSMLGRHMWLQCHRFFFQFLEPTVHEIIQCKANHPNRFDGLLCPRKSNLLGRTSGIVLRTIGSMHDVIATFHGGIESFLNLFFIPSELLGNLLPR